MKLEQEVHFSYFSWWWVSSIWQEIKACSNNYHKTHTVLICGISTSCNKITYAVSHCVTQDIKTTYFPNRTHDLHTQYLSSWFKGFLLLLFVWGPVGDFLVGGFFFVWLLLLQLLLLLLLFLIRENCSYFSLCPQRYKLNRMFCEGVKSFLLLTLTLQLNCEKQYW